MKEKKTTIIFIISIICIVLSCISVIFSFITIFTQRPSYIDKEYYGFNADDIYPNIVLIDTGSKKGSGYILAGDENSVDIVTNFHVINDKLDFINEIGLKLFYNDDIINGSELLGYDEFYDLAYLRVPYNKTYKNQFEIIPSLFNGASVAVVGNHYGRGISVYDGIISNSNSSYVNSSGLKVPCYQVTAPVNQGASGGAVINNVGQLLGIGVAQAVIDTKVDKNTNYVIPMQIVNSLYHFAVNNTHDDKKISSVNAYYIGDELKINNTHLDITIKQNSDGLTITASNDPDFVGKTIYKINDKLIYNFIELTNEISSYSSMGKGDVLKLYFDEKIFRSINGLNHY